MKVLGTATWSPSLVKADVSGMDESCLSHLSWFSNEGHDWRWSTADRRQPQWGWEPWQFSAGYWAPSFGRDNAEGTGNHKGSRVPWNHKKILGKELKRRAYVFFPILPFSTEGGELADKKSQGLPNSASKAGVVQWRRALTCPQGEWIGV